jgi:hypothetical protein
MIVNRFTDSQLADVKACQQRISTDKENFALAMSGFKSCLVKKMTEGPTLAGFFLAGCVTQSLQSNTSRSKSRSIFSTPNFPFGYLTIRYIADQLRKFQQKE